MELAGDQACDLIWPSVRWKRMVFWWNLGKVAILPLCHAETGSATFLCSCRGKWYSVCAGQAIAENANLGLDGLTSDLHLAV